MARRLDATQISNTLAELSDAEFDDSRSEFDGEEEVIEENLEASDSEQSELGDGDEIPPPPPTEDEYDDYRFYIGKDAETLWISVPSALKRTKAKNIV